jgi:hypothetical protein
MAARRRPAADCATERCRETSATETAAKIIVVSCEG